MAIDLIANFYMLKSHVWARWFCFVKRDYFRKNYMKSQDARVQSTKKATDFASGLIHFFPLVKCIS